MKIGGNKQAVIQTYESTQNEIGEDDQTWTDADTLTGWLDLASGDSGSVNFNAKIQESTHIFIGDYKPLLNIDPENSRMIIDGEIYQVKVMDNPMGLNHSWEIYLKYTGGQ